MPSGTRSAGYRGPKSHLKHCNANLSSSLNFTNVLTLTSCCESVRCEQVGRACSEDTSCAYSVTRNTFLQCDSFLQRTRENAIARKATRSSTSASPHHDRCFRLRQLARRGGLANVRSWHQGHHMPESGEWAVRLTRALHDGLKALHEAAGKNKLRSHPHPRPLGRRRSAVAEEGGSHRRGRSAKALNEPVRAGRA
ncbi:hypothetical protein ABIB00_006340 [Bradyrhizobium sp. LB14.3]